jgi:hypothetical protein
MVKFNHTAGNLQQSMGLTQQRADELTASLFFEMINVQHMVESLFDNPDDAPANMTTKTGIMERVFDDVKSSEEMVYVAWEYAKYDVLLNRDEKFAMAHKMMTLSLYTFSNHDKDKFINTYVKKKSEAESNFESESDNED